MSKKAKALLFVALVAIGGIFYLGFNTGYLEGYSRGSSGFNQR